MDFAHAGTDAQLTNVRYRGIIRTSILEGVTAAFDPDRTWTWFDGLRLVANH
jgi:hypothetical protein